MNRIIVILFFKATKMKKLLLIVSILFLQSCFYPHNEPLETSQYTAVFMDRTEFENSVVLQNSKSLIELGKIYTFNDYLFINEKQEGFHIYNNSNPETPIALKYIKVPGATDMAIKSDIIYINQATDLIAVEFDTNTQSLTVTKRIKNVFPELLSPDGYYQSEQDKVLIKWTLN